MIDAEVRELTPHPAAAVRMRAQTSELPSLFDHHLPAIAERLADMGLEPAGPPYARYHVYGPNEVDVEIGIPTSAPLPNVRPLGEASEGEMGNSELPGGSVAVTVHQGPYSGLHGTYQALQEWLRAQGREGAPGPWETYLDDPTDLDESLVRTEICWPVA